jgi:hypothetical protein
MYLRNSHNHSHIFQVTADLVHIIFVVYSNVMSDAWKSTLKAHPPLVCLQLLAVHSLQ